ncbi:unnamed protein product [Leptidea sinapis]|uniref:Uncharacterized protein n=1 Tax=Leptidea sinapis TaxID=189913 RepID=A0A5E4R250_9NEOP|nr:unnamed protein product [Leptidea sinapis]
MTSRYRRGSDRDCERSTNKPCAVPALSYFDLSLAAVARASDLTESVVLRELNERVVEKLEVNEEPSPSPSVVR